MDTLISHVDYSNPQSPELFGLIPPSSDNRGHATPTCIYLLLHCLVVYIHVPGTAMGPVAHVTTMLGWYKIAVAVFNPH